MIKIYERRKILLKRSFINGKIMKKFLCLILSVLLTASFTACDIENSATPDGSPSLSASVTPNGTLLPSASVTPTIKPTATPDKTTDVDGIFNVSEKKYRYNGNDVMIINVQNTSDKAYNIEISASFKTASGSVVAAETKKFEGFAANWSNYFLFTPEVRFDVFEFDINAVEYSGQAIANHIHVEDTFKILVMRQDKQGFIIDRVPITEATQKHLDEGSIRTDLTAYVTLGKSVNFWVSGVLFSPDGEIMAIRENRYFYDVGTKNHGTNKDNLACKGVTVELDTSDIEKLKGATSIGCLVTIGNELNP